MGLATAKQFVQEGAFVYITGRRQAELDAAVKTVGSQAKGVRSDGTKLSDLDALYAQIQQEKGRLDVLFVNVRAARWFRLERSRSNTLTIPSMST